MNLIKREHPDSIGTEIGGNKMTDAYGCEYIYAKATQACVLDTCYILIFDETGAEATTIAAAGTDKHIIVADKALATGVYGWFAMRGPHDMVTPGDAKNDVGDAWKIHTDGVVTVTDAAMGHAGINEFAVAIEAHGTGSAVTSLVYLFGDTCTWA